MVNIQSNEISIKTFTCWLSISCTLPNNDILPSNITKENLEEFFEVKAKEIGEFHSVKLNYVEIHKSFQCYVNFLTEDSAKQAVKLFDQIELENLKIKSEYRPPKENKKPTPLLNHAERRRVAAAKGKAFFLQTQSNKHLRSRSEARPKLKQPVKRPKSNSKACAKQSENIKRYVVIDGNNVAIQ